MPTRAVRSGSLVVEASASMISATRVQCSKSLACCLAGSPKAWRCDIMGTASLVTWCLRGVELREWYEGPGVAAGPLNHVSGETVTRSSVDHHQTGVSF